ncbi:MAG TPA: alkaline phosphatase family protein [Polyangiaceae bacterium]
MRTRFVLLALASTLVLAPAACGSSSNGGNSGGGDGGSGASSSGAGSSGGGSSGGASSSSGGGSTSSGSGGSSSGSGASSSGGSSSGSSGGTGNHIKTIFLILMENHNWSGIKGSSSAPYINNTLLPEASWCTNYYDNPSASHPSEPNYVWLEAATDSFPDNKDTFTCDCDPTAKNSTAATGHLATLLTAKGLTWREYAEDITGTDCPIASSGNYATKHVPFLFFQDVVGSPPSAANATCKANVRPYTELATDLTSGKVAQYNFISPNLCNDMHTSCTGDAIKQGDDWLAAQIPTIMASNAYKNGGAIFITWDESVGGESPIGMIVLSPVAKGKGYQATTKYYHSSMVRTVEEVFGLTPLVNDAANQPSLSDLFTAYP